MEEYIRQCYNWTSKYNLEKSRDIKLIVPVRSHWASDQANSTPGMPWEYGDLQKTGVPALRIQGIRGKGDVRQKGFIWHQFSNCIDKCTVVEENFLSSHPERGFHQSSAFCILSLIFISPYSYQPSPSCPRNFESCTGHGILVPECETRIKSNSGWGDTSHCVQKEKKWTDSVNINHRAVLILVSSGVKLGAREEKRKWAHEKQKGERYIIRC